MKSINVGLLFGGRSCEHEVSVVSARAVFDALTRRRYRVFLVGIDKEGGWHLGESFDALVEGGVVTGGAGETEGGGRRVAVGLELRRGGNLVRAGGTGGAERTGGAEEDLPRLDVVFPVLHGSFGEDGTVQGVLEVCGMPYVGCGVAGSAVAMDKGLTKRVLQAAGIPCAAGVEVTARAWGDKEERAGLCKEAEARLGFPMFVKPANLGSSVGVSKVGTRGELQAAVDLALRFDGKAVVEEGMVGCAEVECAVLEGEEGVEASTVGEIVPSGEFYDYAAKYLEDDAELVVPARIHQHAAETVRQYALRAFRAIGGTGLARVDFFVARGSGRVTLNEVNTMPGFTPISMFPRLWAASGVSYGKLVEQLVELALEQAEARARLQTDFAGEMKEGEEREEGG